MPRITPPRPEDMSNEQRALYDAILAGKRGPGMRREDGTLIGPFNAMLLNPHVGDRVQRLGEALRFDISLPRNVIEVATLVVGSHWRAQFEWWAHERLAKQAGVSEEVIAAIKQGERPHFSDDDEAGAFEVASQLYRTRRLSDTAYAKAVERFGETGLFELIALVGYYSLVSLLLNGFNVPLPDGEIPPFND